MKRSLVLLTLLVFALFSFGFYTFSEDSAYFKINKSLQIFSEIFRQISNGYVDDVDPEAFIRSGVDGMLAYLDPYTTYYEEKESDEIDILTNGTYGGLGITVGVMDSAMTITGITEGFTADRAGLRVGDKLFKIDSTVVLRLNSGELGKYTRGKPGTKASVFAIREGRNDTLRFDVEREEISIKNVLYSGFTDGDVGYIRLERFSRGAPAEVRQAIENLKKIRQLRGLILDLRDNPGGLLDAAVSISEIFVPTGSPIVSTRGRNEAGEKKYVSRSTPMEADLPLAVLLNDRSASASEIVAGAIQDLDRGALIGERSFGKGLVQTISSLPFNGTLKMTSAKYYTPSGRCIQKIDYQKRRGASRSAADSTRIFYTLHKRPVPESNGITPDSTVSVKRLSDFVADLTERNMFFRFATKFSANRTKIPADFAVNKEVLKQFADFLQEQKFSANNSALKKTRELAEIVKNPAYPLALRQKIEKVENDLMNEQAQLIEKNRAEIERQLAYEIYLRFYPRSKVVAMTLKDDIQAKTAISILRNRTAYHAILGDSGKREE